MTWTIPASTPTSFRKGDRGIGVWSLQRALNDLGNTLTLDGYFGTHTESVVKHFQSVRGLTADGIPGPVTQKRLVQDVLATVDLSGIPTGLVDGFARNEGGWLLAAVNHSVPGGVDCGVFQRRLITSDFGIDAAVERAFNTKYQAHLLADSLRGKHDAFLGGKGTGSSSNMPRNEKAWRLAALNHNYPAGAERLASTPIGQLPEYWLSPQQWVRDIGFKFPDDGHLVTTPLEWCHVYAGVLGEEYHHWKGLVTQFVTDW